ncbi:MAG: hypothetical protein HGB21_04825 [Nitrospirae bacterium]|nr:hypothetical protein [Nitrospirota bacterium]NTW65626.1 hypothetical protein [Nitrospirota bacterium]
MADIKTGFLKIHYTDGRSQRFEYERAGETMANVAQVIQEGLELGVLMLQLPDPDRLLAIPFTSIRSIEVVPPPPKLSSLVIKVVNEMEQ